MNIEPLETRIAPAFVVTPTMATFTDVDGDLVTIKSSKPILDDTDFIRVPSGLGEQLQRIDFNDDDVAMVKGVNLTVSAKPQDLDPADADTTKRGDGLVNVGSLQAFGRDLGAIKIAGDLAEIFAGSLTPGTLGVASLSVASIGDYGTSTGAPFGLGGDISGALGSLTIKGNLRGFITTFEKMGPVTIGGSIIGGALRTTGGADMDAVKIGGDLVALGISGFIRSSGKLAGVSVGGSLDARAADSVFAGDVGGSIASVGAMGPVSIGVDVIGGQPFNASADSGAIFSDSTIQSVAIGRDLIGNKTGGRIHAAGKIGSVSIGHDVIGAGPGSASIYTTGAADIGNVTIGGSILGGTGADSGRVVSAGALGVVKIGQNVKGGLGNNSGTVTAKATIAGITVGGSLIGGLDRNVDDTMATSTGVGSGVISSLLEMGPVKIAGSIEGGSGLASGRLENSVGRVASVTIGNSLIGGVGLGSGNIRLDLVGVVKIGGDILGGAGDTSGVLSATKMDAVTVGGSLIGGRDTQLGNGVRDGRESGQITSGDLGPLKIGGSVVGGNSLGSGLIGGANIASVTIGGSLLGGPVTGDFAPDQTGYLSASGTLGPVKIGGDIRGSDGFPSGTTSDTGTIQAKRIVSLTVGGSIVGGTGSVVRSGAITAIDDIGAMTVKGSLVNILITAVGQETPTAKSDIALKSLTVGGRVENVAIELGYDKNQFGKSADAQAGAIKVTGDWIASFIIAGVDPVNGMVGDSGDHKLTGAVRDNDLTSKIASITIGGQVIGKPGTSNVYGFAAEEVGAFKYNGITVPLSAGKDSFAAGKARPIGASLSNANTDGFAVHVLEV